jgi:uncharacterized protein (TIGR00297 family)
MSLKPFGLLASSLAFTIATLIALRGARKKSLSKTGAIAAWLVGFLSVGSGMRGFVLLFFYQIGSSATKYKKAIKEQRDATAFEGSVRGPSQVFACSIIAVILSLAHVCIVGDERAIDFVNSKFASTLTCAILAHHSTCLADTLASELGILSTSLPILILPPWNQVPPGTNGGITLWGTMWSAIGGTMMGIATVMMDLMSRISPVHSVQLIALSTVCGLLGSVIDSLLGATLQVTYLDPDTKLVHHEYSKPHFKHICGKDIFSNVQVNLISVAITTYIGGWVLGPIFFGDK